MAEQQEQLEMEVDTETEVEVEASEEQSGQENVEIVEEDQLLKRCGTHSVARKRLSTTQNKFSKRLRN